MNLFYIKSISVISAFVLFSAFSSVAQIDSVYYHHGTFSSQYGASGGSQHLQTNGFLGMAIRKPMDGL